jgi:site-specific DNA-methyltransferase (adenine-specific)
MAQLVSEGVKVDAIITDPPYGTTACKWDSVIPFDKMWPLLNALIKPKGAIVLFGSEPFSSALRMSNIKNYKYDWIWDKDKASGALLANKMPLKQHENISVFNVCNYYPLMEDAKPDRIRPLSNGNINGCINNITGKMDNKTSANYNPNKRYPHSIVKLSSYSKECNAVNRLHPTQKPVALMEYLIKTYTLEGETVLDFTMGSGSTGVACKNTNRDFIGIELDDKYFNIATKRINDATSLF